MNRNDPHKDETFINIAVIENEIEAQLLVSLLKEGKIPHHVHSYHDTAYDGLFQTQKGWGNISAPVRYKNQIKEMIDQLRNAQPV